MSSNQVQKLQDEIGQLQVEGERLQMEIRGDKERLADTTLEQYAQSVQPLPKNPVRVRRRLEGHLSKIYAMQWSRDSRQVVSAGQDGKLILWEALTANKLAAITLRSTWVMTCAISPSAQRVAVGGLDNNCTIYDLEAAKEALVASARAGLPTLSPLRVLDGHDGFVSECRFLNDREIITSSGDTTLCLWDVERGVCTQRFSGHSGDVMTFCLAQARADDPAGCRTILSGGCDATVRYWDLRTGQCQRIYVGQEGDVNSLSCFPDGQAFVSGADDGALRLFDLRADRELRRYAEDGRGVGVQACDFSHSGRTIYAAYDDSAVEVWDTLKGDRVAILQGHEARVTSLGISPDGCALCTASWDSTLRIWA